MRNGRLRVFVTAWGAAFAIFALRLTCRVRLHGDPRESLRRDGKRYVFAVLHAHQVAAIIDGEPGTGAMVSQSTDGEIIVPALRIRGIVPVRGSGGRGGRKGRGGLAALDALVNHVIGGKPAYLAVDGPRGPRGRVQRGIAVLAQRSEASVICLVPVPSRRWVLRKSWDRLQIPKPLSRIDAHFAEPIEMQPGETTEQLTQRIEQTLHRLERHHDPSEAIHNDRGPSRSAQKSRAAA